MRFVVTYPYESYSEKLFVVGFWAFVVAISLYSLATSESNEKVTWTKLIKKYSIIILAIMVISFVKVITEDTLERMTKDLTFVPFIILTISLTFFIIGLWMTLRPISVAKRTQTALYEDEEFIKKHSFWGEFRKRSWEYGGHKDRVIEMKNPKIVRFWGIIGTIFFLICTLVSLMMLAESYGWQFWK